TPFFGVSAGSVSLRLVFDLRQCPLTRHPEGEAVMTMCQCAGHEKVSCSQTQEYTDRLKESRAFLPLVATARRSCPQERAPRGHPPLTFLISSMSGGTISKRSPTTP